MQRRDRRQTRDPDAETSGGRPALNSAASADSGHLPSTIRHPLTIHHPGDSGSTRGSRAASLQELLRSIATVHPGRL